MKVSLVFVSFLVTFNSYANRDWVFRPPRMDDLLKSGQVVYEDLKSPTFSNETCLTYLSELEENINQIDIKKIDKEKLISDGEKIVTYAWNSRQVLHQRLFEFDQKCVIQIQKTFRQFRFIEDYVLELINHVDHLTPDQIKFQEAPIPLLDNSPSYYAFLRNNEVYSDFLPGDMLVTRGVSFLSGMIARLGERETQFSHIVFVHQDLATQKTRTIESYVGSGVQFYELDVALKNENARILWLRAKNRKLAIDASEMMGKYVQSRIDQNDPVKYDYSLDFTDHETLSCAEVSQVAFENASSHTMTLPLLPNQIQGVRTLTDRLKIAEGATYEPGDMEIDNRFELVGEFRDLRLTRDSRQKDTIMSSMFKWMREKDYVLKDNLKSKLAGGVIFHLRKTFLWPVVKKILKLDNFSTEIPKNMLRTVSLINELGASFQRELRLRDLAFEKQYGLPMGPMELYAAVEEIRRNDFELYKNKKTRKKSKFHKIFRPEPSAQSQFKY